MNVRRAARAGDEDRIETCLIHRFTDRGIPARVFGVGKTRKHFFGAHRVHGFRIYLSLWNCLFTVRLSRPTLRRFDWCENGAISRHGCEPVAIELWAAPLELVAFLSQFLDPLVDRHDAAHLFADRLSVVERKKLIATGHRLAADKS